MRVAVVTKHFPHSEQRWAGHSAYQTLRVLAELCELHVFYPETSYPSFLTPRSSLRAPLDRAWNPDGVEATYIPFPVLPVISRPLNGEVITRQLLPYVRAFAPDVLLSYFVYPDGYAAVRMGRILGVPAVITAVGSDINRISGPLGRVLTRWTLRNADFVSTVSADLLAKARVLGADPARSSAKLNGCDTAVFFPREGGAAREALGIDAKAEVIVFVGRLDLRKGLMELIEAVASLVAQRPRMHCYIIGGGPDRQALLDAIARNGAGAAITVVPACPTEQVSVWMAAADLVTLPSYNEGCPNVIIEALAAGRPVVATEVGGIPELVDDTCGRLVPARDVAALSKALNEVLSMEWNASAIANRHGRSWATVADELYLILEESIRRWQSFSRLPLLDAGDNAR